MNMATRMPAVQLPYATTLDEVAKNLLAYGFTRFFSDNATEDFSALVRGFADITDGPDRDLFRIPPHIKRELLDKKPDIGLLSNTRGEPKEDPRPDEIAEGRICYDETKFTFHFGSRLLGYLACHPGIIARHQQFLTRIATSHSQAILLGYEIAERFDVLLPGYSFTKRMREAEEQVRTRLLRYMCDGTLPGIAQRHRDQCFVTAHKRSDRGQLWLVDWNGTILNELHETHDDSILIFLGRDAWMITRGLLKGVVHGVLDPTFGEEDRPPRHTEVTFLKTTRSEADVTWMTDNLPSLSIPPYVTDYGNGLLAHAA